jgi:hypothetical protein
LLHQVFAQKPELLGHAVEVFDQNGEERLKISVDLLWKVLTTTAEDPRAGEIVCILDALDECRHSELQPLLRNICSFYDERSRISSSMTLKFLVTSRPLQHIENEFSHLSQRIPAIRLAGEEHTDEILYETGLVIEHEIEKIQLDFPMHPKTVRTLRDEFTKVENRTYLWLMLIFDLIRQDLQSVVTSTEREKLFHTIPKSVDTAYTAILNKSTNKDRARKLLNIVCAATRPLSLMEITTALLIQENHKTYEGLEIPPDGFSKTYIRNLCGLFVSVIYGRVFLLHQTAKEFLMAEEECNQLPSNIPCDETWKNSLTAQNSSFLLASICMWFVRLEDFKDPSIKPEDIGQLVSNYEFFEYSAKNWAVHFRTAVILGLDSHILTTLSLELCTDQEGRYVSWKLVFWPSFGSYIRINTFNNLHLASTLGLDFVVGQLLANPGIEVNTADENSQTPLWHAAYEGHDGVVRQLLAAPSINVNAADNDGWTPLWYAAYGGHNGVVRQLLATPSINVNATDIKGKTPLWCAINKRNEQIVAQLLSAPSIDVNAADNAGWTLLWWAIIKGDERMVAQLLSAPSIDVNDAHKNGKTPLSIAQERGHEGIVKLLKIRAIVVADSPAKNSA